MLHQSSTDVVWAMHVREFHKRNHNWPMNQCDHQSCQRADEIITKDNEEKGK